MKRGKVIARGAERSHKMCPKCLEFAQLKEDTQFRKDILDTDHPIRRFVKKLEESVQSGILQYRGSCKLEEIMERSDITTWHNFECTSCGQQFSLVLEPHREGGYWRLVEERREEPLISKQKREHKPLRKMKLTEEEKAELKAKLRGGK